MTGINDEDHGSGQEYPPGSSLLDYVGIDLPVK